MKRVIVAIVLLLAVGVGVTLWMRTRRGQDTGGADLQTVRVERGMVELTVSADGVLKPLTTVMVKSYAGGRVDVLAVDVGDAVQAGELIAKIDPTDMRTAHEQALADVAVAQARLSQARDQAQVQGTLTEVGIAEAQAAHNMALQELERLRQAAHPQARVQLRSSLDAARASLETAQKELERLQQAAHPQARTQARSALDKATSNLALAEKELTRTKGLVNLGYVPKSELDVARNRCDLAQAEIATAQKQWDTLEAQQAAELRSAQSRVAQAVADLAVAQKRWDTLEAEQSAELQSAQARERQVKAGLRRAEAQVVQERLREADLTSAQAQVARAKAQAENTATMLEYTTVRAPRTGVILTKFIEEGTIITSGRSATSQGTDIVELGDLTKMFVEVHMDEADVAKVRVGQPVVIRIDAFPDESFHGVVTRINPQAISQQNITTVLVTVEVQRPDARFKPGMTATCDFLVQQADNALYLPRRAVRKVAGNYVVIVLAGGEMEEVAVKVGLTGDEGTEIQEGLDEGAVVVVPGLMDEGPNISDRMRERGRRAGGAGSFLRR